MRTPPPPPRALTSARSPRRFASSVVYYHPRYICGGGLPLLTPPRSPLCSLTHDVVVAARAPLKAFQTTHKLYKVHAQWLSSSWRIGASSRGRVVRGGAARRLSRFSSHFEFKVTIHLLSIYHFLVWSVKYVMLSECNETDRVRKRPSRQSHPADLSRGMIFPTISS